MKKVTHLTTYEKIVWEAIRYLGNPNKFEIEEFLHYSKSSYVISNTSRQSVKSTLDSLKNKKEIVERKIKSNKYSLRYSLGKESYCKIEPRIKKYIKIIIAKAIQTKNEGKKSNFLKDISLVPDPNRNIVIALKDSTLLGVIDFRSHLPKENIRFPTHFYKQRIGNKIQLGMTELQYFSRLISKDREFSQKNWLSITCLGIAK